MLPESENIVVLKNYFDLACKKLLIPEKEKNQFWYKRLYQKFRARNIQYQFYNTNYVKSLLQIFNNLEKDKVDIGKVNHSVFELYLLFKYANFKPKFSVSAKRKTIEELEEFLNMSIYRYKSKLIKDINLLDNNHSLAQRVLKRLEMFYFAEHYEIFNKMVSDIEYDWCKKNDRFIFLKAFLIYLKEFLDNDRNSFAYLVGQYYAIRAKQNVNIMINRFDTEIRLYKVNKRERSMLKGNK